MSENGTYPELDTSGDDIEPAEYRRMLNRALREGDRRLREGKLGDTALSRYMAEAVAFLQAEREREEAARPNPAASVAEADSFLAGMKQMLADGRITAVRLAEIFPSYIALAEEHLAEAKAFEKELSGVAP
jgi:hypothetical protein